MISSIWTEMDPHVLPNRKKNCDACDLDGELCRLRNVFVIYPPTMVLPLDSMKKPWVYIYTYIYLERDIYIDIAIPRYRYYSPILSLLSNHSYSPSN